MALIDFYFAIGSRYSYLAASQLGAFEVAGHQVRWLPLDSRALVARRGRDPFAGEPVSEQYDWRYRKQDAERWAAFYGIPFLDARGRVAFESGEVALAAVAGSRLGQAQQYALDLFDAMFVDEAVQRLDRAEFGARAERCGWSRDEFEQALDDPQTRALHDETVDAAIAAGVFGVPTFVVGGELFWGNDRLVLVKHHLARLAY